MKLWQRKKEAQEGPPHQEDSIQEVRLKSKFYYKIFLLLVKYSPIVNLIIEIFYSILAYYYVDPIILSFIGGFSFLSIILLYVASYVFQFCGAYRLALNTIIIVNTLALLDGLIGFPLSALNKLRLYIITLIIGIISYIKFITNKK